jgi:transposase
VSGTLFNVNKNTAALYFHRLLEFIAYHREKEARDIFDGETEVDKSYFGGMQKGKQGRGAAGKVTVFGLLKHGGKVYTQVIADTKSTTLVPIIRQKIVPDSVFIQIAGAPIIVWKPKVFSIFP